MAADPRHPLWWLPNALTVLRCVLALLVGWAVLEATLGVYTVSHGVLVSGLTADQLQAATDRTAGHARSWSAIALAAFLVSAATDWLDGALARRWRVESAFGRLLDPIADKLLVAAPLLAIFSAALLFGHRSLLLLAPILAIVFRDASVTALRFSPLGGVALRVTALAKVKTAIELAAIGLPLGVYTIGVWTGQADGFFDLAPLWLALLWIAAALSLVTGAQYIRAALGRGLEN